MSRDWLRETERLSSHNSSLHLQIAFNYGGRSEIIDGINALLRDRQSGQEIIEADLPGFLYDPEMPDLDLVVRTSGEERLSNFLLWYATYAEFVFTDTLWPDFRGWHLISAVNEYQQRRRRKGAPVASTS